MLGVHNDTNVSVPMHTLDLAYVASYYTLRTVKGMSSSAYLSVRGTICGLAMESYIDGQRKNYNYIAKGAKVLEEVELTVRKGESLRKLTVSYSDNAITGLQFVTELQKVKIGDLDHSEHTSEADYFAEDIAILGFEATFGADRMVELSLIIAPIHHETTAAAPLTKPYLNGSSFALVDENFYEQMKQQNDLHQLKSVFKESKEHRKMKSM
jgi:hypothetical protein